MTALMFTSIVFALSAVAGFLGSLTGLGGGVVIVPALALALGVDIKYAIGASLVSVIATSSGAAAAYVREGFSNIRIGMLLEIATTLGAIAGAVLAAHVTTHVIAIVFGLVLVQAAYQSLFKAEPESAAIVESDALGARLRLGSDYPVDGRRERYGVRNVPTGFGLMFGRWSTLRSARHRLRRTQSHRHGPRHEDPLQGLHHYQQLHDRRHCGRQRRRLPQSRLHRSAVTMPVMLGVLAGAFLGTKVLVHARVRTLRIVFGVVVLALAIEMIVNGFTGRI